MLLSERNDELYRKKPKCWDFFRSLGSPKYVVAPMVDQSELAWRMLSRKYGAQLCYTPMLHAGLFATQEEYRKKKFTTCSEDRPLIVQFCANDPQTLLKSARLVEDKVDAVDINLGCPKSIARKGRYGSFLMEDWNLIASLVSLLSQQLRIPVTCKIRIFPDVEKTVCYAKMLEDSGCQLLTIHGRLREQQGQNAGFADWNQIKAVRKALSIPIFANGNILYLEDVHRCLQWTGVQGVMVAESNLYNPAIFTGIHFPITKMAEEYLELCENYSTHPSMIRSHLFKLWRKPLKIHSFMCEELGRANCLENFRCLLNSFNLIYKEEQSESLDLAGLHFSSEVIYLENAVLSRTKVISMWLCQPLVRLSANESYTCLPESQQIFRRKVLELRRQKKLAKRLKAKVCENYELYVPQTNAGLEVVSIATLNPFYLSPCNKEERATCAAALLPAE
ncbi:tRNA-dihydrouridine(16/17) synthase [NAD(P)(+)]-like isoform X2 [Zophobas morio]|uniref:tRNA-dihydrouridine(16/17) synthase [NAD(P)(+)]-like isoform X2 n=1 Tax=Zophobas morio TaxID=2755281 RepID=UPI003083E9C7